ncbi:MAG: GspL/Epsl periplasmic domain-containing protein [Desulfobulbales bacterium]
MPRTIIGLDISEDIVAAVQVKSLMQGYQIINCTAVPLTDAGGIQVALRAVFEEIDPKGSACNSIIEDGHVSFRNLSMPFTDLKKIRQTLGFELETMMASSVDKYLVDFIDIDRTVSQTDIIAASVNRTYLAEHLTNFETLGVEPEILDVRNLPLANQLLMQQDCPDNGMLLSLGSKKCSLIFFLDKKVVLVRQLPFNSKELNRVAVQAAKREQAPSLDLATYETKLLSLCKSISLTLRGLQIETGKNIQPEKIFLTGPGGLVPQTAEIISRDLELPVSSINLQQTAGNIQLSEHLSSVYNPSLMDNGLALAIRERKKIKGFNFRREEFQIKTQLVKLRKELTQAAIYLGIIFLLLAINQGIKYQDLKKRNADLDARIEKIFTQTFPNITNIVDPIHQMKTMISELKNESGSAPGMNMDRTILEILNDISGRIPKDLNLQVDRMVVDQEGIQMRGTTDNFNTVDSIKKGLESSEIYNDVVIASANLDQSGKGVRFEIKMNLSQ